MNLSNPRRAPIVVAALLVALATDSRAQVTTLTSVAADGTQSDRDCDVHAVSSDGRYVLFSSASTLLVPGTTTTFRHVFLKDRTTGGVELLSVDDQGVEANADCKNPRMSDDGTYVVFESAATNLVASDTNNKVDCFLRDRTSGHTEMVSVATSGVQGDADSTLPIVSGDGRYVFFTTGASNFSSVDDNNQADVYLRDRVAGTTTLVSVAVDGTAPNGYSVSDDLTPDGRYAVFECNAHDVVPNDPLTTHLKVLVADLASSTIEVASIASDGSWIQADCTGARIVSDGHLVTFETADLYVVPNDTNNATDVFVRDRTAGTTERVSLGPNGEEAQGFCSHGSMSDDGRFVVFETSAENWDPTDRNVAGDVYLRDLELGSTRRLSLSTDGQGSKWGCWNQALSRDGHVVVFEAGGDELDPNDHNGHTDVYVHERAPTPAASLHYGAGFPGRHGKVPTMDVEADPVIGEAIAIDVSDSSGVWTFGFLLVGLQSADVPTSWGCELLVADLALVVAVPLPPTGYQLDDDVPYDATFWGLSLYLQTLEVDPYAAHGVSATDGLELDFGH
jgi:Tol biopolymer transport system component